MGLLTPFSVSRGGLLYTMIVPGEGFCSLQVVSRGGGEAMVMGEIDNCIMEIKYSDQQSAQFNHAPVSVKS